MEVAHNLAAANAQRQYKLQTGARAKSTEKLSSGYKINRAADDAAGMGISEKMRWQIRGLNRDEQNLSDGISYVQVADGALGEVDEMLHRMSELAVQSANDTNTETDRMAIDQEIQELKGELDRIFDTTSFNNRYIWHGQYLGEEIDHYNYVPAVRTTTNYVRYDTTNKNQEVLPVSNMITHANEDGISISWKTINGTQYETDKISWDELKEKNYSFEMSDYFPDKDNPANPLFESGKPQFKRTLAFSPNSEATVDDMITALDGIGIYTVASLSPSPVLEDSSGNPVSRGVGIGVGIRYDAAYAMNIDFDNADDSFIEPKDGVGKANVTAPADENDTSGIWKVEFDGGALGTLTATVLNATYSTNDTSASTENNFWRWVYPTKGTPYKASFSQSSSGNDLNNLYKALTTEYQGVGDETYNILDKGGSVTLNFAITSENAYTQVGGSSSNLVGTLNITAQINKGDTKEDVFNRIAKDINENTVFDVYTSSGNVDSVTIGQIENSGYQIEIPVMRKIYETDIHLDIQAGALALQSIPIDYKALTTTDLGIADIDITSFESASAAIDAVASALDIVSEQRSYFGAMQNRMEHAKAQVASTSENTQYAESRIRDTDMAKEMVSFSAQNIIAQAGESMLAQANSQLQGVLQLIQQ